ncbi:MAG: hypothetical protein ACRDTT_17085 [Pseudonocardiaceae bacterium]
MHRRDFLCSAPFVAAAAVAPSRDWLLATLDAARPRPGGRVGHEQVAAIREVFAVYQEADVMRGGGHARRALAQYVTGHVLPLVREADPETETGAAGSIAAGYRWPPRTCLRLQPSLRRRPVGSPGSGPRALGESREAAHAVAQSETAFGRIQRDDEPEWARFIDTAYLAGEWANAFVDIARPVESTHFARYSAAEARNQNRARRGALSQAALARAALTNGHVDLDEAVHNANRALDLAVTVKSSRCTEAITELRVRIQPFHAVAIGIECL